MNMGLKERVPELERRFREVLDQASGASESSSKKAVFTQPRRRR